MGIKVKYSEISNYEFQAAMGKLSNCTFSDGGRCAYLVKKMNKALVPIRDLIAKQYRETILDVFATRDAEGKYTEEAFKPIAGKEDEFKAAVKAFEETEVEIERPKFTVEIVKEAKLNAIDQEAIDPILDDSGFEAANQKKGPRAV